MSGTLKVGGNIIASHSGVEGAGEVTLQNATLDSGVVFPADHVIQVVTLSTTAQSSLNNGDEFSSIRKSITPLGTGSRLMITYSLGHVGVSTAADCGFVPLRSTNAGSTFTEFYTGSGGTNRNVMFSYTDVSIFGGNTSSYTLIDPGVSTTAGSAIMYSLKAYTNTGTVYINRRGNDTTNASISTITIVELAA